MTTKGRIEYHFLAFGGLCILFVEVKIVLGTAAERRNDALLMLSLNPMVSTFQHHLCIVCDYTNGRNDFPSTPVYGILCDGQSFRFFSFDGSTKPPTISQGVFGPEEH